MKHKTTSDLHYYSDRLMKKLRMIHSLPVTVIEAPSGHGKTTAVRDLLQSSRPKNVQVLWFTAQDEAAAAGFHRLCQIIGKSTML